MRSTKSPAPGAGPALAFSRANAAFTAAVRGALARAKLRGLVDQGMGPILFTLEERSVISMSELAAAACVPRSTLTGIAARMKERGLIRMAPNPRDGRGTVVALAPKGRAALPRLHRIERELDDMIRQVLSAGEMTGLPRLMIRLAAAFGSA